MSFLRTKTGIYCATFSATLLVVLVTLVIVPEQIVHGDSAGEACEKASGATENKYEKIALYPDAIENITNCYHDSINKLFNAAIKAMVALGKTGDEDKLKQMIAYITPPAAHTQGNIDCTSDAHNISTYCLAERSVIEFAQFRKGMNAVREKLKTDAGADAARIEKIYVEEKNDRIRGGDSDTIAAQKELFETFGSQINRIDEEVKIARSSLDQALASYHELQFALPMHIKYKKVITGLEEYRDKLSKIRRMVELYPVSFIDVTTPACN